MPDNMGKYNPRFSIVDSKNGPAVTMNQGELTVPRKRQQGHSCSRFRISRMTNASEIGRNDESPLSANYQRNLIAEVDSDREKESPGPSRVQSSMNKSRRGALNNTMQE